MGPESPATVRESRSDAQSSLLTFCLGALLFFSTALPSGYLIGIPFKHVAYLATLIALLFLWAQGEIRLDRPLLLVLTLFSGFTVFYILIGAFQAITPFGFVLKEASGMFTAITVVAITLICTTSGAVQNEKVVLYSFYGVFLFSLWKVLVVLGLVFGILSFGQVYGFLLDQAGYRIVSSGIFGGLVRINLIINDYLVTFFLVFMAVSPRLFLKVSKVSRFLFLLIGTACVIFAFSRLLFGLLFLGWLFYFVYQSGFYVRLLITACAVIVVSFSSTWLTGAFEQRFRSAGSDASDSIRSEQIVALIDEWSTSPLIGRGFGAYSKSVVRDPSVPYSYEVQWIGFLAKLGSIGVGLLLLLVGFLYWKVLAGIRQTEHYVLFMTLSAFILGGLTNQYLVSSASGVVYCLHVIVAELLREKATGESA